MVDFILPVWQSFLSYRNHKCIRNFAKGSMRKILTSIIFIFWLTGCAEQVALLGPMTTSAGSGNFLQSSFSSVASYGIKKQTGKSPLGHVKSYVDKHNPERKKENCVNFLEATSSEFCTVIRKRVSLLRDQINHKSKIKRLD